VLSDICDAGLIFWKRMRVAIVGAGVIGLSTAWALRDSAEVTLVDAGVVGGGASAGNAGWVTPSLSGPLPAPGVIRKAMKWMLNRESPLLIRPRPSPDFVRWLWHFACNCRADQHTAGLVATLALSDETQRAYAAMVADGVDFRRHETGLLLLARSETGLEEHAALRASLQSVGYAGTVTEVGRADLATLEPTVHPSVLGGLFAADDWHVDPQQLCLGLREWLERNGRARFREHARVERLVRDGQGWELGMARGEALAVDRVVVAAGAWTSRILRQSGIDCLMQPAKGYSLTGRVAAPPRHALYLTEGKVGCSSFGEMTRIAGTLELAGFDESRHPRRVASLDRIAAEYLTDWKMSGATVWAGFRPATADGLPLIGESALPGLYVATGHGTLGISLAAGTATALGRLIGGERSPDVLEPFRVQRAMSPGLLARRPHSTNHKDQR
jgi:D-amino-acid dehydrogenase